MVTDRFQFPDGLLLYMLPVSTFLEVETKKNTLNSEHFDCFDN